MKKILATSLVALLALTACEKKPAEQPETPTTEAPKTETPAPASQPVDAQNPFPNQSTAPAEAPTAQPDQAHDHSHEGHDHAGHEHTHHGAGDAYQCGDKTFHIAVHDHEGEKEAHITADNITYDLSEDVQSEGRFTSDNSIADDNKGMALVVTGDKVKITTLDDKPLFDCTKKAG